MPIKIETAPAPREGLETLTAFIGGKAAGSALLNRSPKYSVYRRLGVFEIQDLEVLPGFRRRGVGGALLAFCEDRAREEGCEAVGISVPLSGRYGPAQRLYARRGYIPDGQGATYDRQNVAHGSMQRIDDGLCLMLIKTL